MTSEARSQVLRNDRLMYQLAETIDAVKYYFPLGRDLLGSQAAVSNIIGRTEPDYQEIVFKCLYTWRNANGKGKGERLVEIFKGVELDKVAAYLEHALARNPNCLGEDRFLQSLASKIDCASVYRKLGLPLLDNNSARLSNLIGPLNIQFTQYREALFQVLIRWRNREGSYLKSLESLKKTLLRHGLSDTAHQLHHMEYGHDSGPLEVVDIDCKEQSIPSFIDEKMETDGPSANSALSQEQFYDIYLYASSKDTQYFLTMKQLIHRIGWKMTSCFDLELGEPVMGSIEKALLKCSHVVCLITRDDCNHEVNVERTMTIEMTFQSLKDKGLSRSLIPIYCGVPESSLPLSLRALRGVSIEDHDLEKLLRNSIDVSIRKKREEEFRNVSELSTHTDANDPLPLISSSEATFQ
nr:uncharacterized protein LOC129263083 [Lytechinus pictus]